MGKWGGRALVSWKWCHKIQATEHIHRGGAPRLAGVRTRLWKGQDWGWLAALTATAGKGTVSGEGWTCRLRGSKNMSMRTGSQDGIERAVVILQRDCAKCITRDQKLRVKSQAANQKTLPITAEKKPRRSSSSRFSGNQKAPHDRVRFKPPPNPSSFIWINHPSFLFSFLCYEA